MQDFGLPVMGSTWINLLINTKSYLWVNYLWVIFCIFAVENQ